MRQAYLHIGIEKTGTTSIQQFLKINRSKLRQQGFCYPSAPGDRNHRALAVAAMNESRVDDLRRYAGVTTPRQVTDFRLSLVESLRNEVSNNQDIIFILSNEHCHSRLRTRHEVETLSTMLHQVFDKVEVCLYLRRQDLLALSLYSTLIKVGGTTKQVFPPDGKMHHYYNFQDLLERWSAYFPIAWIGVFDRALLHEGSVVSDFCLRLGIQGDYDQVEDENQSISPAYQESLRLLNAELPRFIKEKPNPARRGLVEAITRLGAGPGWKPSRKDAQAFLSRFAGSNEAVRRRFLPGEDQLFDCDMTMYPEQEHEGALSLAQQVKITSELWSIAAGRVLERDAEILHLKAMLGEHDGRLNEAVRLLRRSVAINPTSQSAQDDLARVRKMCERKRDDTRDGSRRDRRRP